MNGCNSLFHSCKVKTLKRGPKTHTSSHIGPNENIVVSIDMTIPIFTGRILFYSYFN